MQEIGGVEVHGRAWSGNNKGRRGVIKGEGDEARWREGSIKRMRIGRRT